MATQMFKDMMAELSHDDMVEECFEAVIQLRQLKQQLEGKEQELLEERKDVERLKTVVQGLEARNRSFSMEIAYLTSRPVLCSITRRQARMRRRRLPMLQPFGKSMCSATGSRAWCASGGWMTR